MTGENACGFKQPCPENDVRKLEKHKKIYVCILRPKQKPWTGFKAGEKLTTCSLQPRGKSSMRSWGWKADVAQERGEMTTAAQHRAAVFCLSGKKLLTKTTDEWAWFREVGRAVAWLVPTAALQHCLCRCLWLHLRCWGCCPARSCSEQRPQECGAPWGAQMQEASLEKQPHCSVSSVPLLCVL